MKKKTVTDETLISALMSCSTLSAAADQCGMSVRQLYDRRRDPDFIKKLRAAQSEALGGTVRFLQTSTATAAQTLVQICEKGQEQNRLNAARTLLEQTARLTEIVDVVERLERLEGMNNE